MELPATLVFSHPSIEDITDHLCELLGVKDSSAAVSFDQEIPLCSSHENMEVTIVGISCRSPGGVVRQIDYWGLISDGGDTSSHIPFSRWDVFSLAAHSKLNSA